MSEDPVNNKKIRIPFLKPSFVSFYVPFFRKHKKPRTTERFRHPQNELSFKVSLTSVSKLILLPSIQVQSPLLRNRGERRFGGGEAGVSSLKKMFELV